MARYSASDTPTVITISVDRVVSHAIQPVELR